MTLSIWPINCILLVVTVLAFVWRMMSLSHTWYVLAELKRLIYFLFFSWMHVDLLHLPMTLGVTDSLGLMIDICRCWFHSSPFNFWAMRTDTAHSNEIWFNTSCSKNWRCVHTSSFIKKIEAMLLNYVSILSLLLRHFEMWMISCYFSRLLKNATSKVVIAHILAKLPLH